MVTGGFRVKVAFACRAGFSGCVLRVHVELR